MKIVDGFATIPREKVVATMVRFSSCKKIFQQYEDSLETPIRKLWNKSLFLAEKKTLKQLMELLQS